MEQNRTPKCAVVGYGSWATAIVKTLTTNRHHINWLVLNEEILQSLERRGRNSKSMASPLLLSSFSATRRETERVKPAVAKVENIV